MLFCFAYQHILYFINEIIYELAVIMHHAHPYYITTCQFRFSIFQFNIKTRILNKRDMI